MMLASPVLLPSGVDISVEDTVLGPLKDSIEFRALISPGLKLIMMSLLEVERFQNPKHCGKFTK